MSRGAPVRAPRSVVARSNEYPAVAKLNLTKLKTARKATLKKALKYKAAKKAKLKAAARKQSDKDLLEQWRALRRVGVYSTKETPALSRLTKSRREEIRRKFNRVQELARYEQGEAYRPFHREIHEKTIYREDSFGRRKKIGTREYLRYELDKDHFQLVKGKTRESVPDALRGSKGILAAKGANQKIKINKSGRVEVVETQGAAKTVFTKEPISGPVELIRLMEDIKAGKIKLRKNEALQLTNNGRKKTVYTKNKLMNLALLMERYMTPGVLLRERGGRGNFDDWANNAQVYKIRYR